MRGMDGRRAGRVAGGVLVLALGALGACDDSGGGGARDTGPAFDIQFVTGTGTSTAPDSVVGETEVVSEVVNETEAEVEVEVVSEVANETEVEVEVEVVNETEVVSEVVPETEVVSEVVPETEVVTEVTHETETSGPACGDGTCAADEDCLSCASDCAPCPEACGVDLFISQYLEGTSWNKAIEIANFTGHDVDLVDYGVGHITNGGAWSEALPPLMLSGVLAHGEVVVVCHSSSEPALLANCDLASAGNAMEFNGDDAVGLFRNGLLIDAVGTEGADPGTGFAVGTTAKGTLDHTLLRRATVVTGNTDWVTAQYEWIAHQVDEVGSFGKHNVAATCHPVDPPRVKVNEIRAGSGGSDFIELASIAPGPTSLAGWQLTSTNGSYTFPASPAGATLAGGGFVVVDQATLGFGLGQVDMLWLYDAAGSIQDIASWGAGDFAAGEAWGRSPDGVGAFRALTVPTPGATNEGPDHTCGDGTCDADETCGSCSADCDLCPPAAGDLLVTEVLASPASGPEWFEVTNVTARELELAGLIVRDDGSDFHSVDPTGGSWIVGPGEVVVFGSATAGFVDYVYAGFGLDASDAIVLETAGVTTIEVDRRAYSNLAANTSLTLTEAAPAALDASLAASSSAWCVVPAAGATPGVANAPCTVCGDGACTLGVGGETCTSCPADCGACCGDGTCASGEGGESCTSCPADCGACCGDGTCASGAGGEDCTSCPTDCGACTFPGCASELFISEYLEGTSNNKAIEIANMTGAPVDLSGYSVSKIMNGGAWGEETIALPATTLASGEVWVVCNVSSVQAILDVCDQPTANANWNGNDAVGLAKGAVVIDAIGEPTASGTVWSAGGVPGATQDHDLRRLGSVARPHTDWAATSATDWVVGGPTAFTDLGAHTTDYVCVPP